MSQIEEDYDSDDPLAPPRERLQPTIITKHEKTPPRKQQPFNPRLWKKTGPSQSDRSIVTNLNANRPDLSDELAGTVLQFEPDSSPGSTSSKKNDQEEEDLDEKLGREMMQKKQEEDMKFVTGRALGLMPTPKFSPPLGYYAPVNNPVKEEEMLDAPNRTLVSLEPTSKLSDKASNGLRIEIDNEKFIRPSLHTAIPKPAPPQIHSVPRKNSLPIGLGSGSWLLQSPVRDFVRTADNLEQILPPMKSPSSPQKLQGPASPNAHIKLPPIDPLFRMADGINTNQRNIHRQRQHSMSALSSMTTPSPSYTYPGITSPFSFGQSPPVTGNGATSPRDWARRLPSSAATSPPFSATFSPYRRASQATEPFPPLYPASSASEYGPSPDATSPETNSNTNITTPSERSAVISHEALRPAPLIQPPTPTSMGPPHHSPLAEMSPRSGTGPNENGGSLLPAFGSGPVSQPQGTGIYKCDHPGCDAQPFHTQYLLK
jgi:hypothetical protein